MAAVYKVGKKWRADFTDLEDKRHRQRFNTKGQADEYLDGIKGQLKDGRYVVPQNIPTFGTLADSWIAERIEQSRTPGAGYRPSSLSQWQSHVAHMKSSFDAVKANQIDAQAIEKEQGGRGLSVKTVGKVLTTMTGFLDSAFAIRQPRVSRLPRQS